MPQINYATITNDFIKDGFFSEYLPPAFNIQNNFDPCSVALSSSADLVFSLKSAFADGTSPVSVHLTFTQSGSQKAVRKKMHAKSIGLLACISFGNLL